LETLKKEVLIGLIIGIISNVAGSYLYIYFFSTFSLEETINKAIETNVIGNIIALGAILNLFVFFIFIKKTNKLFFKIQLFFLRVFSINLMFELKL